MIFSICSKISTWFNGVPLGVDGYGNKYFEDTNKDGKKLRRVVYNGLNEASKVPPNWHGWLHYFIDEPPVDNALQYEWQKEHMPNLTGTKHAYRPQGHMSKGGVRVKVQSDYVAWKPEN